VETLESSDPDRDERRYKQIIGKIATLKAVFEQVECFAPTDSTVLIQEETCTGKELIARTIHNVGASNCFEFR
jgi:transcriptional regulator with GAF, ATPase, and Fis domain